MKFTKSQAFLVTVTLHARLSEGNLADYPFARISTPDHFACLHGSSLGAQNGVMGLHVELESPRGFHGGDESITDGIVCIAVDGGPTGSSLPGAHSAKCAALNGRKRGDPASNIDESCIYDVLPAPTDLVPGCHVLTAWWQSRDGAQVGSAHPVLFRVPAVDGGACVSSCSANATETTYDTPESLPVGAAITPDGDSDALYETTSDASAAAIVRETPNVVTGGCALGDPRCCSQGCCEYVNLASQCSVYADGLPPCGSCLSATAPPAWPSQLTAALPAPGRQAAELYLELVKRAVLDDLTTTIRGAPLQAASIDLGSNMPNIDGAHAVAAAEAQRRAETAAAKMDGHVWPAEHAAALSMVGRRRLNHVHSLLDDVVLRNVPGDVAECGCWRGGVAALAAAVLRAAGELCLAPGDHASKGDGSFGNNGNSKQSSGSREPYESAVKNSSCSSHLGSDSSGSGSRAVWLLDSFAGLPPPNLTAYPLDAPHVGEAQTANAQQGGNLEQNSVGFVKAALQQLGVYDPLGTRFVAGFFKDSLPRALARGEMQALSILRLDGDLYESTIQALHYLYPSVSVGGHVIVDDFTDWVGCRRAVADFRLVRGIDAQQEPIQIVWHEPLLGEQVRGVWWTKAPRMPQATDDLLSGSSRLSRWHLDYDPLDPHGLQPEDYAAAAAEIRRRQAA